MVVVWYSYTAGPGSGLVRQLCVRACARVMWCTHDCVVLKGCARSTVSAPWTLQMVCAIDLSPHSAGPAASRTTHNRESLRGVGSWGGAGLTFHGKPCPQ